MIITKVFGTDSNANTKYSNKIQMKNNNNNNNNIHKNAQLNEFKSGDKHVIFSCYYVIICYNLYYMSVQITQI